jgi:high-affinity iron transporter
MSHTTLAPDRGGARRRHAVHLVSRIAMGGGVLVIVGLLIWQGLLAAGNPDPMAPHTGSTAAVIDIGVLVFREGLECILVLAAITASLAGSGDRFQRPIAAGAGIAFIATLITWWIAVSVIDGLSNSFPALDVQAATGLLAIVVLVVVMNWFFHKVYWTGWISLHTKKKRQLVEHAAEPGSSRFRVLSGLALLGFSSFYREGFEVVLFLQNYRLKLGTAPVLRGVLLGLGLTGIVGVLTFVAHRRLPYRKMLVLTGVLLGGVLLVMVGEQAQEMQLAHWIPTTPIPALAGLIPGWAGLWFSIFPTVETLAAQVIAAVLVLGSYAIVRFQMHKRATMLFCGTRPQEQPAERVAERAMEEPVREPIREPVREPVRAPLAAPATRGR